MRSQELIEDSKVQVLRKWVINNDHMQFYDQKKLPRSCIGFSYPSMIKILSPNFYYWI